MVSCLPRSRGGGDVVNYDATPIVDLDTDYIYFYDYTHVFLWSDRCPHLFEVTFEIMYDHIVVQWQLFRHFFAKNNVFIIIYLSSAYCCESHFLVIIINLCDCLNIQIMVPS